MQETPVGLEPAGEGWFVVNVRDTAWLTHEAFGSGCVFESREGAAFPELGINIGVLQPGQPACLYHEEGAQEDFLVLAGDAAARAFFDRLSYTQRKELVRWVEEAKKAETRTTRIARTVESLHAGKRAH